MKFFAAFFLLLILLSSSSCSKLISEQEDSFSAFETVVSQVNKSEKETFLSSDTILEDSCLTSVEIYPYHINTNIAEITEDKLSQIFEDILYENAMTILNWIYTGNGLQINTAMACETYSNEILTYFFVENIENIQTLKAICETVFSCNFLENYVYPIFFEGENPLFVEEDGFLYFNTNTGGATAHLPDFSRVEVISKTAELYEITVPMVSLDDPNGFPYTYRIVVQNGNLVLDSFFFFDREEETEVLEISAESATFLVEREMYGEPIGNILLNPMNGVDVYNGDVSTDNQFSATWDLMAPDGERLVSYTGKPELFRLELFSDHLAMSSSGTPWDMFVTDRTISRLFEDAYEQYNTDGTVLVNEFMRFQVTTKNGDIIPLSVIGLEKGEGHISESRFFFDRTVTAEAVSFAMEIFLPDGVEPEQYPSLNIHNREYVLWKAAEDRPKQAEDMSMSITIRRDSGYNFYTVESAGSAMWFDAIVVNETLCLTTDVELSGALYEELLDCNRTVWDDYGEYTQEVMLNKLPKILDIRMTTLERDAREEKVSRIRPQVLVQENDDGTTSLLLTGIIYERMVGCTLKIQLPE